MEVKTIKQTCLACPSQWEGELQDSQPIYIRYRWGTLTVSVGKVGDLFDNLLSWKVVYKDQIGEQFDGVISWEEVEKIIGGIDESTS